MSIEPTQHQLDNIAKRRAANPSQEDIIAAMTNYLSVKQDEHFIDRLYIVGKTKAAECILALFGRCLSRESSSPAEMDVLRLTIEILKEEMEADQDELNAWRDAAEYDATMEGRPKFKRWNRSQLDRARKISEARGPHPMKATDD